MTTAISIENLEWKYEHTTDFALKGINLEIQEHTFVGIVGANEQGKTSLAMAISGLIPHSFNGIYLGHVKVFGKTVQEMDALSLATQVGFVFADPEAQFTAMTVEEELAFGLENTGAGLAEIKERLEWAAGITMISDLLDKSPYDISGGQKQRVAIACVLAMNPPIIILDEPTSMIDPLGKRTIFDLLRRLKEGGSHTIIVIEHNIEQLAPLADEMILMADGRVDRTSPPNKFFSDPAYLRSRGVLTPETTEFVQWLQSQDQIPPGTPLPFSLPQAVSITRQAITGRKPA